MAYTRGRDGADTPAPRSTIGDAEWESLNRRRGRHALDTESDMVHEDRQNRSDEQRRKASES